MPLTRDQILALRKEFEHEFGSGEADWADSSPEGLQLWARTHPFDWIIDAPAPGSFRVANRGAYGNVSVANEIQWSGNLFLINVGQVFSGRAPIASTVMGFLTRVHTVGATKTTVGGQVIPVNTSKAPIETQFEAVLT